jgi:DNA-binding NtrC family response regulator
MIQSFPCLADYDTGSADSDTTATNMPIDDLTSWEVLVVDDDDAVRELIVAYFNGLGMPVTSAQDGRSAISTLQRARGRFGLVVTDLNLPGADGFAVLQAARQSNASCYVVIITGYASLDSAILAVRVGAYDYLAKPFSLKQLDLILDRITERNALESDRQSRGLPTAAQSTSSAIVEATVVPATTFPGLEVRVAQLESAVGKIQSVLQGVSRRPTLLRP